MSLVKFSARNHRQQLLVRGPIRDVDDRATTAAPHNAKCERFYTAEQDGLAQSWAGESVWCNPPYSEIAPWVEKAWEECERTRSIVMLLPANRTEQTWWQEMVEPYRDREGSPLRVTFLRGRLRFIAAGKNEVGPNERPPFGCCLLIWRAANAKEADVAA